jgi:thiopurine S-methyltransferase
MDASYWRARWHEGRIGFHEGKPNEVLVRLAAEVLGTPDRVLVPLCGKAVDLAWIAAERHASVVGIELAEDAARAFFEEQGLPVHRTVDGALQRFEGGPIEIVVGDFFEVTTAEIGTFAAAYDRAALVALPAELRAPYVAHLRTLLVPGARILLISFVHDGSDPTLPPFSVDAAEVRRLFEGCALEQLEDRDVTAASPTLLARGARSVREQAWRIEIPS